MRELNVEANDENLSVVLGFVDEVLESAGFMPEVKISVALEEMYVNVAHYAYAPKTGRIRISAGVLDDPKRLVIILEDGGVPFNPLDKKDPDTSLDTSTRPIGGLGIFMTKKIMDKMEYERRDGKNIVTLTKNLQ